MELKNNRIFESDQGKIAYLRERGFGALVSPSLLRLSPCEVLYLCKKTGEKIFRNKKSMGLAALLHHLSKNDKFLKMRFACFEQLRAGGRICREHFLPSQYMRVYSRGIGREDERAQTLLRVCEKNWKATRESLERDISVAHFMRKELVLAFVQGSSISYVKLSKINFD